MQQCRSPGILLCSNDHGPAAHGNALFSSSVCMYIQVVADFFLQSRRQAHAAAPGMPIMIDNMLYKQCIPWSLSQGCTFLLCMQGSRSSRAPATHCYPPSELHRWPLLLVVEAQLPNQAQCTRCFHRRRRPAAAALTNLMLPAEVDSSSALLSALCCCCCTMASKSDCKE